MHRDHRFASITHFLSIAVALAVFSCALAGSAHAGDDKLIRLKVTTNQVGKHVIMVLPPHAKIWRDNPNKPKKINWTAVNYSAYDDLFCELRYDSSKGEGAANYFGDVDIECGETEIEVQPDIKPDSPNAEWPYTVTVYACVDGVKGQEVATVDARIVWND
jgi:hypothetical protein